MMVVLDSQYLWMALIVLVILALIFRGSLPVMVINALTLVVVTLLIIYVLTRFVF